MNRVQAAKVGSGVPFLFDSNHAAARLIAAAIASAARFGSSPTTASAADESLPAGFKIASIEAQPTTIDLKNRFDYRQLLLTATLAGGEKIDVTRMADLSQPAPSIVEISSDRNGSPAGRWQKRIAICAWPGKSVAIPVTVAGMDADYQVSFVRDVMPTISKIGCNAGTCHGSAKGKNGFKLSLRGYDPGRRLSGLDRRSGRPPVQPRHARAKLDAAQTERARCRTWAAC